MALMQFHAPEDAAAWLRARVRGALQADSRAVRAGDGFIAWPGAATDGRRHVADALAQGATACLVEHEGVDAFAFGGEAIATYAGLKAATGPIAAGAATLTTSVAAAGITAATGVSFAARGRVASSRFTSIGLRRGRPTLTPRRVARRLS